MVTFVGRFHPVVMHIPIGVLLCLGLVELLRMFRRRVTDGGVVRGLMFFGAAGAVVAALCGFLLYRSNPEDYGKELVQRHMWGGILVAACAVLTYVVKVWADSCGSGNWLFRLMLFATCGVTVYASHDGGSLTHGEDYLLRHAPPELLEWLGREPAGEEEVAKPLEEQLAYADIVAPVLERRCVQCHGAEKQKGKLRVDSHELLVKGGKEGPGIEPGSAAKSNVIVRIEKPEDDDERMPPEGKPGLEEHELVVLKWWLDAGAPVDKKFGEMNPPQEVRDAVAKLAPPARKGHEAETANREEQATEEAADAVSAERAKLEELVAKVNKELPGAVTFESRESNGVVFTAVSVRQSFGDEAFAKLEPLLPHLVSVDLSATQVGDAAVAKLAAATRLRMLRLSETKITDAAVEGLAKLPELESLNLFGTAVGDQAVQKLGGHPKLKRLYLWQTKVTPEGVDALKKAMPGCEVVLGV